MPPAKKQKVEAPKKLWGGRFNGQTDPVMEKFNESLTVDKAMGVEDVQGTLVYAAALGSVGIYTKDEATRVRSALQTIHDEQTAARAAGTDVEWLEGATDEDIHSLHERILSAREPDLGPKVHTGRSRNDQVATDLKLHLKYRSSMLASAFHRAIHAATSAGRASESIIMPGYTHLQQAQPIRVGFWLASHASAWLRDLSRLRDAIHRADECPLGSGAMAGNAFGVDRTAIAADLNFDRPTLSAYDSVSDRDHVAEVLFVLSLASMHLSRFAEDVIFFCASHFVTLSDAYCTGSSLMPQKKNPDSMELVRGMSGMSLGSLVSMLTILKGLPSSYNKDLQFDKELLFSALDRFHDALHIVTGVMETWTWHEETIRAAMNPGLLATDMAEYLVRKGMAFRRAHHVVGEVVKACEDRGVPLGQLDLPTLQGIDSTFEADVVNIFNFEASVEAKASLGGTALQQVRQTLDAIDARVDRDEKEHRR
jgi:argininosuccinate lyase